jgi:hypothetical protein
MAYQFMPKNANFRRCSAAGNDQHNTPKTTGRGCLFPQTDRRAAFFGADEAMPREEATAIIKRTL